MMDSADASLLSHIFLGVGPGLFAVDAYTGALLTERSDLSSPVCGRRINLTQL
jgi:hypothetical protein